VTTKNVAETSEDLKIDLPLSFPCPTDDIFSIPKVEDILKPLQEIAQLPDKLDAKIALMKKEKEEEIVALNKKLQNPDLTDEERNAILTEIEVAEDYIDRVLLGELFEEFNEIKEDISKFFDNMQSILSPFWKKREGTEKRNLQKELEDALTEVFSEFALFIPIKISELIQKLVPLSLTINILGLEIDIIKIVIAPDYRTEIQDQIGGKNFVTQIISKRKELAKINERLTEEIFVLSAEEIDKLEKEKEQLEKDILTLEEKRTKLIDTFFNLVPEAQRKFDGEISELNNDARAKLIWDYIKKEMKEWVLNAHVKAFEKLIDLFKEIWDALGLPKLPFSQIAELLTMDISALIETLVSELKRKFQTTASELKGKIKKIDKKLETETDPATIEKLNEEKRELEQKLTDEKGKYLRALEDHVLGFVIPIIGMTVEEIIGGENISTTISLEERLAKFQAALEDFKQNWMQKLLFGWVKLVEKFFAAIGLGAIIDLLLLTMCDFLKLIGNPFAVMIAIPNLDGILESTTYKPKVRVNTSSRSRVEGVASFDSDGETSQFAVPSGSGDIKVFVNGVAQSGSSVTITSSTVTFEENPNEFDLVSIIKV
jgi:hypothetical protein